MKSKSFFFESVASTQDKAREILEGDSSLEAVWVRASHQTKGRGRQGRVWIDNAMPSDAFLCSLALRAPQFCYGIEMVSLAAGLALYQAIGPQKRGEIELGLKWPNDLVVYKNRVLHKKLGGILCESRGQNLIVVVGWGVNLGGDQAESVATAASIENIFRIKLNPNELQKQLEQKFFALRSKTAQELSESLSTGPMDCLWGSVGDLPTSETAEVVGLGTMGQLIVKVGDQLRTINSGELRSQYSE